MSPEYFVIPLIMNQATSIIETLKTGIIIFDFSILLIFIFMFYMTDINYIKRYYYSWNENRKNSIVICNEQKARSIRFRAIMYFLAKQNESVYRIREDTEFDWDDLEKRSEYLVDQMKDFKLTDTIHGKIKNEEKDKVRNPETNNNLVVEYNTLIIFSYKHNLTYLQKWIDEKVKEYKEYLKTSSNEKQLFITVSSDTTSEKVGKNKKKSGLTIDSVEWDSSITFENSYFQEMDEIIKKIDFFLNNKKWYMQRGIPYNLGILLHGEPGCGKTRFIKQLMNHTGRHGIDIKLNDAMDFTNLQNIIYKEELDDTHIIPQMQRILIFEDIDALGDVVKDRDLKKVESDTSSDISIHDSHFVNLEPENNNNNKNNNNNNNDILNQFLKLSNASSCTQAKYNNNLSYLLNMLDGIHECSGRILIMTTNKIDVLDKALIRPGRIDIKINFQKCSLYDISKMIEKFWNIVIPSETILPEIERKYTNAEIINIFRSTDDFESIRNDFCISS
jgi:ATP-dependent 26S proteasome regulatory subunit